MAREMLLASQRAVPMRLSQRGFRFAFPELEGALRFELGGAPPRVPALRGRRAPGGSGCAIATACPMSSVSAGADEQHRPRRPGRCDVRRPGVARPDAVPSPAGPSTSAGARTMVQSSSLWRTLPVAPCAAGRRRRRSRRAASPGVRAARVARVAARPRAGGGEGRRAGARRIAHGADHVERAQGVDGGILVPPGTPKRDDHRVPAVDGHR